AAVELVRRGVTALALDDEEAATRRGRAARRRAQGLNAEWLDAAALHEVEPRANPAARGGALHPDDGRVACERFLEALGEGARQRGASLVPGAEVRAVERRGDRLGRREGAGSRVPPDTVRLAAGAR